MLAPRDDNVAGCLWFGCPWTGPFDPLDAERTAIPPLERSRFQRDGRPVSALDDFDAIAQRVRQQELALFLDYDGTLTPIVRRAEDAVLTEQMRSLLRELARHARVAIVSGRDRRDAEQMVAIEGLIYAGSHGFDIRSPDFELQHEAAQLALPDLDAAESRLRRQLEQVPGARVERKRFAVAVHCREVESESDRTIVEAHVDGACAACAALRKRGGKRVFELQPDVPWDKGRAMLWLLESMGLANRQAVAMYLGDDVTDEDAFAVLAGRDDGIGIRVAEPSEPTQARYVLANCGQVEEFLRRLLATLA